MKNSFPYTVNLSAFFLVALFYSCEEVSSNHRNKIVRLDSLVSYHKKNILFLDFWFGMTKDEFQLVMKHNLEEGKIAVTEQEEPEYIYQLLVEKSDTNTAQIYTDALEAKVRFDFDSSNILREVRLYILPMREFTLEDIPQSSEKIYLNNECANKIIEMYTVKYGRPVDSGFTQQERLPTLSSKAEVVEWMKDQKLISLSQEVEYVYTKDSEFYNAPELVEKQIASISILYANYNYYKLLAANRKKIDMVNNKIRRLEMAKKLEDI